MPIAPNDRLLLANASLILANTKTPSMITVIATIQCVPGHRDDFITEFKKIVPDVLNENGCIEYGPTIDAVTDLEKQNTDENRVTIVEKWESIETLKAHLIAPHMMDYRPKVQNFVESSELRILSAD